MWRRHGDDAPIVSLKPRDLGEILAELPTLWHLGFGLLRRADA